MQTPTMQRIQVADVRIAGSNFDDFPTHDIFTKQFFCFAVPRLPKLALVITMNCQIDHFELVLCDAVMASEYSTSHHQITAITPGEELVEYI